ncbi:MAG: sulfatase-like hydrolase/transferase, partial [Planctomycetota bacterium]
MVKSLRFLSGCVAVVLTVSVAAADSPNVLFIAVDDLNDWIGCLNGHPQALTPNMDELASRGMLFTNAHCAAPACNPSRAAVFSGLMPNVTKVWSNSAGQIDKVYPGALQLPTAFNKAGYHTAGTGKLYHKKGRAQFSKYQGYSQRWSPFPGRAVKYTKAEQPSKGTKNPRHVLKDSRGREVVLPINRMPSDRRPHTNDGESFDWGGFDLPDTDWGDTQSANWAIERLGEKRDKPLFLAVGFYRPHIPLFAPKRFFNRFRKDPGQLPPYLKDDLNDLSEVGKKVGLQRRCGVLARRSQAPRRQAAHVHRRTLQRLDLAGEALEVVGWPLRLRALRNELQDAA